jgi:hypothetical protein
VTRGALTQLCTDKMSIVSTGLGLFQFDGQNSVLAIRNMKPVSKSFCTDTDRIINKSALVSKSDFDSEYFFF